MAAGAAMAVVGWWSGYKLGGVVALSTAEYYENIGVADYWQATFLVLGCIVISMNICLIFVHEPIKDDREEKQKETDKIIAKSRGSNKFFNNFLIYITGTIVGPIISFLKMDLL